jgi:hypothetical protein
MTTMKLLSILLLATLPLRAATTEAVSEVRDSGGTVFAESGVFSFDIRDSNGTTEAISGVFGVDARNLGSSGSAGSVGFVLNTLGNSPTNLEIVGPSTVVAGSATDYKVIWQAGNTQVDVTAGARWRFLTAAPGNTGMVPPTFYAGETTTAATVQVVASYVESGGQSRETAPFSITITPRMQAAVTAVRQNPANGLVNFNAGVQGASGTVVVNWDLDGDGQFDDASGESVTRDYGTWTGTSKVKVEVIDGPGNRRIEERNVILNKAPVANQPVLSKPAYDPGGFQLFNPDAGRTPFQFNSARRQSGLVVIAHGLYVDGKSPWLRDMALAIERRCDDPSVNIEAPNIALLDWSDMAGDPSELPEWQKALLKKMIEGGLKKRNLTAVATGAAGEAINFGFDLYGVKELGLTTGQMLANWTYLNSQLGSLPQIDPDKPIHLIGHSAGGFVVGEAARLLKHPQNASFPVVHVDRVTLLDTPLPSKDHFALGSARYPNPGTVERYISSFYGDLDEPLAILTSPHGWYRKQYVLKSWLPSDTLNTGTSGHGYSYVWFTNETIDPMGRMEADGFAYSPIINAATRISKPYTPPQPAPIPKDAPQPDPPAYQDIVMSGWETFGNTSENTGTWTFTESSDAGIWKDLTLPQTAATLAFEFHFLNAGDGDFLSVHFGDGAVLYRGLDLPLSRDSWLSAVIPMELLPSMDGRLVFTLVSRGNPNAQVQVRNIRITQSEDADGDALLVVDETTIGTDPRNPDSDGDGITDGDEVNVHATDPKRADSDGDGQSDPSELAAGTNPLANGSLLRVTSAAKTPAGFVLHWSGVSGKSYRVIRSQELGTGNYETLAFSVPGAVPSTSYVDTNPPPLKAFYWIEVE